MMHNLKLSNISISAPLTSTMQHSIINMTSIPAAIIIPIPQSGNIYVSALASESLTYTGEVGDVIPIVTTEKQVIIYIL